ncbi:MAG: NADH dehydrogenase [Phycisphaerae bacterium]
MAWITKNSAGTKIERRATPYLDEPTKARLRTDILPRYETRLGALLPTLHAVQHQHGWLPPQALLEIAEFLQITPAEVYDTASFYEEYWLKPKGEHLIAVCRSIACEFCGQPQITEAIKQRLGIDVGETTPDGKWTLIEVECLGSCGSAPAMLVDETLHEWLTPAEALKKLDQAPAAHHGHH